MKIALDVGHANGTGASGNGLQEHDVCQKVAAHLRTLLEGEHHVAVIDFAEKTNREDLNATVKALNEYPYDFGIFLHCDCSDKEEAHGAHGCYVSGKGRKLAEAIAASLCKLLPGRAQHVVCRTDLAVLRHTKPVMVLVECGFISNVYDSTMQRFRPHVIAEAIAEGVRAYISTL